MTNDLYWVLASDIHFPKHDKRLVDLLMKAMDYIQPDAIDLVGDIDDADSTSRWAAGTSREGLSLEDFGVRETREFMAELSGLYPHADRHLHDGNHGWYRHKQYLDKKAPATLEYISADTLYQYKDTGFEFHHYDHPPVKRYGDIYVHHGESISKHAGESVRNDVDKYGVSLIRGHSHRLGSYYYSYPLRNEILRGYEIGHLCDPGQMDYDRNPNWQPGFALAHVSGDQVFVNLIEIRDYKCSIDGKILST